MNLTIINLLLAFPEIKIFNVKPFVGRLTVQKHRHPVVNSTECRVTQTILGHQNYICLLALVFGFLMLLC